MNVYLYTLGQRVRNRRKELGMTLVDFATKCGFDQPYASHIESGRINVTYTTLLKIASVLNVPVEAIARTEVTPLMPKK